MRVLLINGSPRGKRSNSLKLAMSFVSGLVEEIHQSEGDVSVDEVHLSTLNIAPCKGCFACWKATPGKCCIHDDMAQIIEKQLAADLVVWSFPLYYFGVPGTLKNMIDRQLPVVLPFMSERPDGYGSGSHSLRYERKSKNVIVSTCGFWSAGGNYDGVTAMFDHMLGKGNFESIFCGQGELFSVKELSQRTDEYLSVVKRAGSEYANGAILDSTKEELGRPLYPKDVFEAMADASWGVDQKTGKKDSADLILTKQMATLYNKDAYDGKDRVLEMHYTDLGTSYQILLGKDGSKVFTDGSLETTTRIDTPFEVWQAISRGELNASAALGKQLYSVDGDFSLMTSWNKYFGTTGGGASANQTDAPSTQLGAPSMLVMLIPWITFWVAVSISAVSGAIVTLAVTALMPVIFRNRKFVLWDWLSFVAIIGLSLAAAFLGDGDTVTTVGYLVFGLMWLGSCWTKEPLCASYVKYNYGGDAALNNPLFMKTNVILAACWGVLYVLTALWTWFGRHAGIGDEIIIANNVVPIAMGVFTKWFQQWYPARLARGGKASK